MDFEETIMDTLEQNKVRLLVVDDDAMVLESISTIFEFHGFEVWSCRNSSSALALLEQGQPDVLLTDIRMPGMSGTDLLLHLKQSGYTFPVLVMTGYADLDAAVNAVKGGAFDFIKKPHDPDYLVQAVSRAVKHHRLLLLEQEYLKQLEQEVQLKTAELERTSRLKTEFLNNISHEIRTPANGIVGMLTLAGMADSRDERQEFLRYAEQAALQLVRIVNDLVILSGIVTGTGQPEFEVCNIRDIAASALERVKAMHPKAELFTISTDPAMPEQLLLELTLVEMALFQLFENEVKFALPGTVQVSLQYRQPAGMLEMVICDAGPGMSPEKLQQVTELFVQGDGSNTRTQGGLGIGLSIVAKIAACLQGNFTLTSSQGCGIEARLVIPASQPTAVPPL